MIRFFEQLPPLKDCTLKCPLCDGKGCEPLVKCASDEYGTCNLCWGRGVASEQQVADYMTETLSK